MDNEQTTPDFEQVPIYSFNADSSEETLSVMLKYKNKKSMMVLSFYFLLLLLLELIVMRILTVYVDEQILIYVFIGSVIITVSFLLFMLYGMIKSAKKQLVMFRASPPSYASYELYAKKLVIKKYSDGELKSLYTVEKGTLAHCDISNNVFIFKNDGIDFGIKTATLDQHPEVKKFIVDNCQRISKKISA